MRDWIVGLIVNLILDLVRKGEVERFAEKVKAILQAWVMEQEAELMGRLRREAEASDTPIDDAVVAVVQSFVDALLTLDFGPQSVSEGGLAAG